MAEDFETLGCKHYKRKCAFISPCCGKVYTCRLCHDEKEMHTIERTSVKQIQCLGCRVKQKVKAVCSHCKVTFGKYFCEVCRLYDDDEKGQFHCEGCGICRVGGRDKYFHCSKCDMCMPISSQEQHKCIEKVSRTNCPVCMEDLHTSRDGSTIPPCGHLIHGTCYKQMLSKGHFACPMCGEAMVEMDNIWKRLDEEVANTQMPEEYRDTIINSLCKDCHKTSKTKFHVLGQKCQHCGSYNTCGADDDIEENPNTAGYEETGAGDTASPNDVDERSVAAQTIDTESERTGTSVD
ncbi:unnamed protein product [Owenia fusiformis]|uniref:Uncharacterized protein n=1 Tax=Owenia fusiformis TaxID=6347 RepID=A0A8J1Y9Q8_OWEFU|nr:unnamed protein product [Owenia fusiformis]